ncbi:MAG: hemerythrin domain-containing protein [Dehalococcoidales bacterium]|nr:hemerythrin domain-containing protein [Dehalococcoidales bacterium]
MKKPTELLKEEHQGVLQKLDALEDVINNLEHKEKASARLKELTSFFDTDFWVHFDKEGKALFPEFDNFMPRGAGPLAVMMDEHEVLRETNVVVHEAVTRYLDDDDSAAVIQVIRQNGTHFIEFLRNHIFKEDSILFRMAEMHLQQAQNERVIRLFAEIERTTKSDLK